MEHLMTLRKDTQAWYKQPWPWILMAGPAIVVIAGFITAWLAVTTNDGLVSDDYYKQGLTVNQRLQRDHQAGKLGLHADIMRADKGVRLILSAAESAVLPNEIVLKLAHPTRAGYDQSVRLVNEGAGFYAGTMSEDISGRWLVSIEDPAGQWRLQGDWQADAEKPLRLVAKVD
jgi:hypothetical protein